MKQLSKKQKKYLLLSHKLQKLRKDIKSNGTKSKALIQNYVEYGIQRDKIWWNNPCVRNFDINTDETEVEMYNRIRKNEAIKNLNWSKHTLPERTFLKNAYEQGTEFYWQGLVSDISYPSKTNTNGYILLNHIINLKPTAHYLSIHVDDNIQQILDYHLWLPIKAIRKIPNNMQSQSLAIGDIIFGKSIACKYKSQDKIKYGLGTTEIIDSGIYYSRDNCCFSDHIGQQLMDAKLINYKRLDPVLNISKKKNYETILNRHRNLQSLGYSHEYPLIIRFYETNYDRYYKRLTDSDYRKKELTKITKELMEVHDHAKKRNQLINEIMKKDTPLAKSLKPNISGITLVTKRGIAKYKLMSNYGTTDEKEKRSTV